MTTNFPASNDVFDVPSDPANTPLVSAGDGGRGHGDHHRDLGDAIEAMQAQQTLLAHSHDGTTFRHGSKLAQANTHQSPDTDSGTGSLHHTIGSGANQYAAGDHTHVTVTTYPIGAFFFAVVSTNPSSLGVAGTWTSVGQRFLVADGGSLGLTAGAQGGSNSHSHSIDASTNTVSSHDHVLSSSTTGADGGHTHTGLTCFSAGASHTHTLNSKTIGNTGIIASGSSTWVNDPHDHTSGSASASHGHTSSTLNTTSDATHTVSSPTTSSSGSHSHTNSTPSTTNNLVPLLVVYMWKRTA